MRKDQEQGYTEPTSPAYIHTWKPAKKREVPRSRNLRKLPIMIQPLLEPGASTPHYWHNDHRLCDNKPWGQEVWEDRIPEVFCHACTVIYVDDIAGPAPKMDPRPKEDDDA